MTDTTPQPFQMTRLGVVMAGDPDDPYEAWGVLNPASCRDRNGDLLLFPRVVAAGNYSRIGCARVEFSADRPTGVTRLGYALEPAEGFERNPQTAGVEDPRVCYVAALSCYVMTYTGYSPLGPRIALAVSEDGHSWRRLGLAKFSYMAQYHTDFDLYVNKDAMLFPEPVLDPNGQPALAMLHRPDYHVQWWNPEGMVVQPAGIDETRPSMWISYLPLAAAQRDLSNLCLWQQHHLLATPLYPWETLKIGGGTPPVLTKLGWLTLFHGVSGRIIAGVDLQPDVHYSAGVMILDRNDPRQILYRSPTPVLAPMTGDEQQGMVNNVVFPTAVDPRPDGTIDVYYGMADAKIGAARLTLPDNLPE